MFSLFSNGVFGVFLEVGVACAHRTGYNNNIQESSWCSLTETLLHVTSIDISFMLLVTNWNRAISQALDATSQTIIHPQDPQLLLYATHSLHRPLTWIDYTT